MKHRLVATAGHVDHGKTSLLKQLTGTDADRLDEEKERGLTIDIGFADLARDGCHVGFIDVPGHHNFIKNMVSGVGSVQGVLFVVSATDGWQAQSREHFEIINLLQPEFVLFAITKIDRADEELTLLVEGEIEQAIEGTAFEEATIKPVSSETGEGIDELNDTLFQLIDETPEPADHGKPYCPIDRVFSVKGQGTVVTGSLSDGHLETEDQILRQPADERGRVRGLQQYHEDVDRASHPARVAVNVPDWDHDEVTRGDVLTVQSAGETVTELDGSLELSRHLSSPLEHNSQILAYAGTARSKVRVLTPDQHALEAGATSLLRMKHLEDKGFYRPGGRVILRDFSDRRLIGCLTVLNPAPVRSLGDTEYREWLDRRRPVTIENLIETDLMAEPAQTASELSHGQRYSESEIEQTASELDSLRSVKGDLWIRESWWENKVAEVLERVDQYHEEFPHRPGLALSECRAIPEELRETLVESIAEQGYVVDDNRIRRESFQPRLDSEAEDNYQSLVELLREEGLEAPDRSELEDRFGSDVVEFGIHGGDLLVIDEDRLLEQSVFDELKQSVVTFMEDGDPKRLSDLRDHLQSSRQYVIPFMEYLDRQGVTIRDGDVRHLSQSK